MSTPEQPLVVIGVGNVLLGDDAIGVRVVEGLRRLAEHDPLALPRETRLVDGGTLLRDLPHTVKGARGLVLVDALRAGDQEGTISVRHGDAIVSAGGARERSEPDSIGELLAVARLMGWLPEPVALVGIEVAHIDYGVELSPVVAAALPAAIVAVADELRVMDEQIASQRHTAGQARRTTGATA